MPKLPFPLFVSCFRKQFVFQKDECRYYTNYNNEQGMPHDRWGIMAFIDLGREYGFDDAVLQGELNISGECFEGIDLEMKSLQWESEFDAAVLRKLNVKKGLVKNVISLHLLLTA